MTVPETPTGGFLLQTIPTISPPQSSSSSFSMVTTPPPSSWAPHSHLFSPPHSDSSSHVPLGLPLVPSKIPVAPIMQGFYPSSPSVPSETRLSTDHAHVNAVPKPRCIPRESSLLACPFRACNGEGTIDIGEEKNLTIGLIREHIGSCHMTADKELQDLKTGLEGGADTNVRCPVVLEGGLVCGKECHKNTYPRHCIEKHCPLNALLWECTVPRCMNKPTMTHRRRENVTKHILRCWRSYQD